MLSQAECRASIGFNLWSGYFDIVAHGTPLAITTSIFVNRVLGLAENDALTPLGPDDFEFCRAINALIRNSHTVYDAIDE